MGLLAMQVQYGEAIRNIPVHPVHFLIQGQRVALNATPVNTANSPRRQNAHIAPPGVTAVEQAQLMCRIAKFAVLTAMVSVILKVVAHVI